MPDLFIKQDHTAPDGFYAAEAAGLRWLAAATAGGGVAAAGPVRAERHRIVLPRLEPVEPTPQHAEDFGRRLARTHAAGAPAHGAAPPGHDGPGFIGPLPMPYCTAGTATDWGTFYAELRLGPFLRSARDAGAIGPADVAAVEAVRRRLLDGDEELTGPAEPVARLHGDLWFGNIVWTAGGAVLIDPSAHGGHRETDLAMLTLFDIPHRDRILAAYDEEAPLADGWRERVALHRLYPLLVHGTLFGGSYGARAGAVARRYA